MTRKKLDSYLGKTVEIKLFTGKAYKGVLHKCDDGLFSSNYSIDCKHNYYVLAGKEPIVMSSIFRLHHVKKLTELVYVGKRIDEKEK